jgi:hypothetical protein
VLLWWEVGLVLAGERESGKIVITGAKVAGNYYLTYPYFDYTSSSYS